MTEKKPTPRLTLGHTTLAARDLDRLSAFYCDVLGFHVTNRGPVPGGNEIAFQAGDLDDQTGEVVSAGIYVATIPAPIPEPSTAALLGGGLLALAAARRCAGRCG